MKKLAIGELDQPYNVYLINTRGHIRLWMYNLFKI